MRHFLTDNSPLIHGQAVDHDNGQFLSGSFRGEPVGHVLRNLMKHDRPRQIGKAVQRGVMRDHPLAEALLNLLVCGVEAILILGRHISRQGPTQCDDLGPTSCRLNPLMMIAAHRWAVGVQQLQEPSETRCVVGGLGSRHADS